MLHIPMRGYRTKLRALTQLELLISAAPPPESPALPTTPFQRHPTPLRSSSGGPHAAAGRRHPQSGRESRSPRSIWPGQETTRGVQSQVNTWLQPHARSRLWLEAAQHRGLCINPSLSFWASRMPTNPSRRFIRGCPKPGILNLNEPRFLGEVTHVLSSLFAPALCKPRSQVWMRPKHRPTQRLQPAAHGAGLAFPGTPTPPERDGVAVKHPPGGLMTRNRLEIAFYLPLDIRD